MRKSKLEVYNEFGANIVGIVSAIKDYKLAWNINQVFSINLVMQPSAVIEFIKGADLSIVNFTYQSETQQIKLIKNRSTADSGYLIPELANFDFFLMIGGEENLLMEKPLEGLSNIKDIEYYQYIDVSKLKSRDNFIF